MRYSQDVFVSFDFREILMVCDFFGLFQKLLQLQPTMEEKTKIQEAQMSNPDIPLGTAEQFLLTMSSINELTPRLHLWSFKLDYDQLERVRL